MFVRLIPISNRDFNGLLKQKFKPWFILPQPEWLLKIGAMFSSDADGVDFEKQESVAGETKVKRV